MHPTGMHSCFSFLVTEFTKSYNSYLLSVSIPTKSLRSNGVISKTSLSCLSFDLSSLKRLKNLSNDDPTSIRSKLSLN